MATIVVLFNLKDGVDQDAYERFARERDSPTVNGMASVDAFSVLKASGLFGGGASPYAYVELIEVPDLEAFGAEAATDAVQEVVGQFATFADNPLFLVTDRIA